MQKYVDNLKSLGGEIIRDLKETPSPTLLQPLTYTRGVYKILHLTSMSKRINIVLPEATVLTIDRMARPGAARRAVSRVGRKSLGSIGRHKRTS